MLNMNKILKCIAPKQKQRIQWFAYDVIKISFMSVKRNLSQILITACKTVIYDFVPNFKSFESTDEELQFRAIEIEKISFLLHGKTAWWALGCFPTWPLFNVQKR